MFSWKPSFWDCWFNEGIWVPRTTPHFTFLYLHVLLFFLKQCVKIINGIKITTAILYDVLMNQVFNIYFLILSFRDSFMVITIISLSRKQTTVGRDYKPAQQFSLPYCLCSCNFFSLPFWNKTAFLYCNRTVLIVSFSFQSQEYGFSLNAMMSIYPHTDYTQGQYIIWYIVGLFL